MFVLVFILQTGFSKKEYFKFKKDKKTVIYTFCS